MECIPILLDVLMRAKYSVLFIIDPIKFLEPGHDTSLGLMEAGLQSGQRIYICTNTDLTVQVSEHIGATVARVREVVGFEAIRPQRQLGLEGRPIMSDKTELMPLHVEPGATTAGTDLPAPALVLQRQDSRQDWTTQQIVSRLHPDICVINRGMATLSTEDKIAAIQEFPEFCPASCVSADLDALGAFIKTRQTLGDTKIVLKATQSYGGRDVEIIELDLPGTWWQRLQEFMTAKIQSHRSTVIAQQYLPAVSHGDLRVFCVNGVALAAVNRIPAQAGSLANMAQGGTGHAMRMEDVPSAIRTMAHTIAQTLKGRGIYLLGIDFIGKEVPYLTELNPGSPTGLMETAHQLDGQVCHQAWRHIQQVVHAHGQP